MGQVHPDPFQEAMHHGLQRALQIAASAATAVQVYAYHQRSQTRGVSERDERARRALNAQTRAERDAGRAGWSPALDPQWLRKADLMDAARAWGAAMPYADRDVPWYEPSAATAMRKCEERLRALHPYAMAYYDRLRSQGASPGQAMAQAAPLFARPSHAHDAPMAPRPALVAGDGTGIEWTAGPPDVGPPQPGTDAGAQERRGRQRVEALQARAREQERGPLGEDEQRTVLETITDLPPDVIDRVVKASASGIAMTSKTNPDCGAQPWRNDFPAPIQEVVATARHAPASGPPTAASRSAREIGRHARRRT
jgi:hypothetical protein